MLLHTRLPKHWGHLVLPQLMFLLVLGDPYLLPITSNLTTWEEDPCPLQPLLIEKHLLFSHLHSQPPLSGFDFHHRLNSSNICNICFRRCSSNSNNDPPESLGEYVQVDGTGENIASQGSYLSSQSSAPETNLLIFSVPSTVTVPDVWPVVPIVAVNRHPVFPKFIKIVEVSLLVVGTC